MFKLISRFFDRVFGVSGAFCFAQFPQFFDVYKQRLSGHLAEIKLQVDQLRASATLSGKTVDEYIDGFLSSNDISYSQQGKVMKEMLERWSSLNEAVVSLQDSTSLTRPWVFISQIQPSVVEGVVEEFQPGLTFTLESGAYALVGIVFGTAVFFLIRSFFSTCGRVCVTGLKKTFMRREHSHRKERR